MNLRQRLEAAKAKNGIANEPMVQAMKAELSPLAAYQQSMDERRQETRAIRQAARDEIAEQSFNLGLAKGAEVTEEVARFLKSRKRPEGIRVRGGALLVQVSDVHFGGTVKGLEQREDSNEFNLEVAAHRLAAYAAQVEFFAAAHSVEELVIAFTGDVFDSKIGKCRLDKMLHAEGTASLAYMRGRDLVFQFIDSLYSSEMFGRIRVCGIAGNEARLYSDRGHGHVTASDNWDALLNADLAARYRGGDIECEFGVNRYVAEVQGWRVLMLHGDQGLDHNLSQHRTQSLLGTFDAHFGISGHIHDTLVTGKWIRSASLVGTDAYAGDGLGLEGRASQNIFWLAPGQRNTYAIDLQSPDPLVEPFSLFDYAGAFGFTETL